MSYALFNIVNLLIFGVAALLHLTLNGGHLAVLVAQLVASAVLITWFVVAGVRR